MRCSWTREFLVVAIFVTMMFAPRLRAQEYRAKITGTVTDSSKAVVPNATIEIHDLDTGEITAVKTNREGIYSVPYLHPGQRYDVSAKAPGFNTESYPPTTLSIAQILTANFTLHVGAATQEVTVTSENYKVALDTESADRGTLIDNKTITQMPLNGRNPLSMLDYVPGVTNEAGPGLETTPNNMYNISFFTFNGNPTQNTEYLIDGMPDNSNPWYSSGPSTVPSVDAMQEFKVITSPYDASYGHSASGIVDMGLKSGTNSLRGSVYEFAKRGYMDANSWANNYNGLNRPAHTEDQYGFELDGPVYIPHIYYGRDKTFFMFNFERFKEVLPNYATFDLPNPAWLNGDFSGFTDPSGAMIPVYDPATATTSDPTRKIFQNSQGQFNHVDPSRFDPIAVNIVKLILSQTPVTKQSFPGELPWEQIWVDTIPSTNSSQNYVLKIDQVLGAKDHLSGSWIRSYNPSESWSSPTDAPEWFNGSTFTEYHMNAGLDWTHTFTNHLLSDVRFSYQRYWRTDGPPAASLNYDPSQLGFSSSLLNELPLKSGFPIVGFNMQQQSAGTGNGYFNWMSTSRDYYYMPDDSYNLAPTITWERGRHNIRAGIDMRDSHLWQDTQWDNIISYASNGIATSEYWDQNASNDIATAPDGTPLSQTSSGNAVLDFLISQPNSVAVLNQVFPYYTWHYYAPWIQDDWKITRTFTLNLGFRYDFNGPPTARHDWLNTGFDFNAVNPVNALVSVPGVPTLKGGITFPNTSGTNTPWARDYTKWQPRLGFAWLVHPGTVLRGGAGRMVMNSVAEPQEYGFTNNPAYINSPDGGRTYHPDNVGNPFPSGIPTIPGASQGLMTYVGQGIAYANPNFKLPYSINGSLELQQAIPHDGKMTLAYVMSRSYDNPVTYTGRDTNFTYYKTCNPLLDTPSSLYHQGNCENLTPNPFYGVPGVTGSLGANRRTSLYQLERPYPEFAGITETMNNWGRTWYNSLQATYQQHLGWQQINATYTWSKTMQSGGYTNDVYLSPARSIASTDRMNRVTMTMIFYIPVGRGKRYFSGMNRVTDAVVGGWELAADGFAEGGQPVQIPNGYDLIGPIKLHGMTRSFNVINAGMNPCTKIWHNATPSLPGYFSLEEYGSQVNNCSAGAPAWQQVPSYAPGHNNGNVSIYSGQVRSPGTNQLDVNLSKNFKLGKRFTLQLRMEEFNVLNHPTWFQQIDNNPMDTTFGQVNKPESYGQSNNPRQGQLGVKITW